MDRKQVQLVGVGPAVFAYVFQFSEAKPDVWTNMHPVREGTEHGVDLVFVEKSQGALVHYPRSD
jgi:hypothetical protein